MKLAKCIEIGNKCGLHTIEECYDNIYLHMQNIFKYEEIKKELLELQKDIFYDYPKYFCEIFDADIDDLVSRGWKINNDCSQCINYNCEQAAKYYGHPCNIYGQCIDNCKEFNKNEIK